jgi:hypothetical protein
VTRFIDSNGKDCNRGGRSGPWRDHRCGEFLIDLCTWRKWSMRHASPAKKNMEFVLNSEIIDSQAGTPKMEASYFWWCSLGFAPVPCSAARTAGQEQSCLQP